MSKRDYYEILGIQKNAEVEEIKKAYRKLAIETHPDKHQGDKAAEERFKEISEAYEVLSDTNKRATYDRFGHEGLKGAFGGGGFSWQNFTHFSDLEDIFDNLGDLFRNFGGSADIFGQGRSRRRRGPARGRDIMQEIQIDFLEAALGTEKNVEIYRYDACPTCDGSGAKPGTKDTICKACAGQGQVNTVSGFFSISRTCSTCGGSGRVIETPCQRCAGKGKVRVKKKIKVKIPAGIDTGMRLRVAGEGDEGEKGGPRGDLYVFINVRKHRFFKRHDNNIYCEVKISFTKAVFGSDIEVPTIYGKNRLKIPSGTQSGKIFTLKGKGVPDLVTRGGKGDQLLRVVVDVPQDLTEEQEAILRGFAKTLNEEVPSKKDGFIQKVKKVFK